VLIPLLIPLGTTVLEAIERSGILQRFPSIQVDSLSNRVGIFGNIVPLETKLKEGDRVEIYRPLILDPKEARRLRAKKQKRET
jgi:putative ubiquitin-RnfH superfamily antitoxin RatB of RatAB toxin-antitoxin module